MRFPAKACARRRLLIPSTSWLGAGAGQARLGYGVVAFQVQPHLLHRGANLQSVNPGPGLTGRLQSSLMGWVELPAGLDPAHRPYFARPCLNTTEPERLLQHCRQGEQARLCILFSWDSLLFFSLFLSYDRPRCLQTVFWEIPAAWRAPFSAEVLIMLRALGGSCFRNMR